MGDVKGTFYGTLNDFADMCHLDNLKWWQDLDTGEPIDRNFGELIALCHSELSEALEGHRKNLADNHLPQFENWEVEMADLLIRVFDICGAYQVDLSKVFAAKREYNANREDHKREARLQANGKKY